MATKLKYFQYVIEYQNNGWHFMQNLSWLEVTQEAADLTAEAYVKNIEKFLSPYPFRAIANGFRYAE